MIGKNVVSVRDFLQEMKLHLEIVPNAIAKWDFSILQVVVAAYFVESRGCQHGKQDYILLYAI